MSAARRVKAAERVVNIIPPRTVMDIGGSRVENIGSKVLYARVGPASITLSHRPPANYGHRKVTG